MEAEFWGIKARTLFKVEPTGKVTVEAYDPSTLIVSRGPFLPPGHEISVYVAESHIRYQKGEPTEHNIGYCTSAFLRRSNGQISGTISTHGFHYPSREQLNPNDLQPIDLPTKYRVLYLLQATKAMQTSQGIPPERQDYMSCLFHFRANTAIADFDDLLDKEDLTEAQLRAFRDVIKVLGGDVIGIDRLSKITKSKLPNLDAAIESCTEFGILVDLSALEKELQAGLLKESELLRKLLH